MKILLTVALPLLQLFLPPSCINLVPKVDKKKFAVSITTALDEINFILWEIIFSNFEVNLISFVQLLRFISRFVTVDLKEECGPASSSGIWFHIFHQYAFTCFIYKPRRNDDVEPFFPPEKGEKFADSKMKSDFYFYLRLMMQSEAKNLRWNLRRTDGSSALLSSSSEFAFRPFPLSVTTTCVRRSTLVRISISICSAEKKTLFKWERRYSSESSEIIAGWKRYG